LGEGEGKVLQSKKREILDEREGGGGIRRGENSFKNVYGKTKGRLFDRGGQESKEKGGISKIGPFFKGKEGGGWKKGPKKEKGGSIVSREGILEGDALEDGKKAKSKKGGGNWL